MRALCPPILALCLSGCTSTTTGPEDGGADVRDGRGDGFLSDVTDVGEEGDGGGIPQPGSLTLVASRIEALLDRHCDHDGNGVGDNAAADLGEPESTLFAAALSGAFQTGTEAGQERIMARFPRLDDRRGPSHVGAALLHFYEGVDLEWPQDPTDDYSGEEPFQVDINAMEPCGEPSYVFPDARLEGGRLASGPGTIPIPLSNDIVLAVPEARVEGTVEAAGVAADFWTCFAPSVKVLGEIPDYRDGLSMLELLLLGGAGFGLPTITGLEPDVDLDGDGLERFEVSAEGVLLRCIDGDATVIEGRDCWRDDRMADAFALVLEMGWVGAGFAGRHVDWEPDASCPSPPSPSAWSDCASDEACRPGTRCLEMEEERNVGIFLCE